MNAQLILQAVIDGIMLGGVYASLAVGQSLTFGVMRVINWAQGECLMIAMYIAYYTISLTHLDPYLTLFTTGGIMFLFGYILQKYIFNRIMAREETNETGTALLFTAGLGLALTNLALILFGPTPKLAVTRYQGMKISVNNLIISIPKLISFLIALACTALLYVFLQKSESGRALRATSQNRTVARIMGIKVERLFCLCFGLGFALIGIGASLLSPFFAVYPTVGLSFSFRSFIIVVLGGRGSVEGALLAGILVGLIEKVGGLFMYESYAQALTFVLFVVTLIFRPNGLLGKQTE